MKTLGTAAIRCSLIFLLPLVAYAGSATWDLNPTSGNWNTAANWTPMTVPNGSGDTATFALSNTTNISVGFPGFLIDGITFTPAAANSYTITVRRGPDFTVLGFFGAGITNNSGTIQNFVTTTVAFLAFENSATAGSLTHFRNKAGPSGTLGGVTDFFETSSAGSSMFVNDGGTVAAPNGGATFFLGHSTGGSGTFINNGGTAAGAGGGGTSFIVDSSAGSGTFINNGGTVAGAGGGVTGIGTTAESATLIANGGTGGGDGGRIVFYGDANGGTSRVEVFGNGNLDISSHAPPGVTVGSIEGDGDIFLGSNNLIEGSNNLTTTFSGVLQDGGRAGGIGGSLTKTGLSALTLSGANTYTGNTKIKGGVLKLNGSITSNTFVNSGSTLAGTGAVIGDVTNSGSTLSPGDPLGTLTVKGNYTQSSAGTLLIDIAGSGAGQFSVLDVLGSANLSGHLDPVLLNGFIPMVGESFTFLLYGSHTGSFFSIHDPNIDGVMEHWVVDYQPSGASLTAVAGNVSVPDQVSTLLLLTLSLLGVLMYRWQLLREPA